MKRIASIFACGLLTACSSGEFRDTLGLNNSAPDEFRVVSRPPLSVPQEFYLRPPMPGEEQNFSVDAPSAARSVVTGKTPSASERSLEAASRGLADTAAPVVRAESLGLAGDSRLLENIGAAGRDPEIRQKLYSEDRERRLEAAQADILDKLRGDYEAADPIVDAKGEAERIRKNLDEDKPLTEGETVTRGAEKKSTLDRVLDF